MHSFIQINKKVHRLIPSKFPPISLFDWAESQEELEQIALLEGLTNERIQTELGRIHLVPKEDWVGGQGATVLMSAFTHIGYPSRFSDGSYGLYYAAASLKTAIKETVFHRELFYKASQEKPCTISMREYLAQVKQPLIDLNQDQYAEFLKPDLACYEKSQPFGKKIHEERHWGLSYPSQRDKNGSCVAIFRPPALSKPIQGCHLKYYWDGSQIAEIYKEKRVFQLEVSKTS